MGSLGMLRGGDPRRRPGKSYAHSFMRVSLNRAAALESTARRGTGGRKTTRETGTTGGGSLNAK